MGVHRLTGLCAIGEFEESRLEKQFREMYRLAFANGKGDARPFRGEMDGEPRIVPVPYPLDEEHRQVFVSSRDGERDGTLFLPGGDRVPVSGLVAVGG